MVYVSFYLEKSKKKKAGAQSFHNSIENSGSLTGSTSQRWDPPQNLNKCARHSFFLLFRKCFRVFPRARYTAPALFLSYFYETIELLMICKEVSDMFLFRVEE
jgi:hypothetical protein